MKKFIEENWRWLVNLVLIITACFLYFTNPEIYREHRIIFYSSAVFSTLTLLYLHISGAEYDRNAGCAEMLLVAVYFLAITIMWKCPISFYWVYIPFAIISIVMTWRWSASDKEFAKGDVTLLVLVLLFVFYFSMQARTNRQEKEYIAQATPEVVRLTYVDNSGDMAYIDGMGIFTIAAKDSGELKTGDVVKIIVIGKRIVWLQGCTPEEIKNAIAAETLTVNYIDRGPIETIIILSGKGVLKVGRDVSTEGIEPQDNVNVKIYKGEIIQITKI